MRESWLPISYRDFYDVPRLFLVEHSGSLFVFDCPFDDKLDDYRDAYSVYRLTPELRGSIDTIEWHLLVTRLEPVASVPVRSVEFDPTRRTSVKADIFGSLWGQETPGSATVLKVKGGDEES